jgi:hypothetical protein
LLIHTDDARIDLRAIPGKSLIATWTKVAGQLCIVATAVMAVMGAATQKKSHKRMKTISSNIKEPQNKSRMVCFGW